MGPFGKNTHNGGNVRNVPVYEVKPCPDYVFHGIAPLGRSLQKSTFINNLGKIRRK